MTTLFEKIIAREIPAQIVYEDEHVVGFNDINPQAPVHVLFVPRIALPTLDAALPEHQALLGQLLLAAAAHARALGIADNGYRVLINCNRDGGQTVFHLHLHLLAGRALGWPPG